MVMDNEISKLLLDMGVPPKLKGNTFLNGAIQYAARHPDATARDIYRYIAALCMTSPGCVEFGIRHAIGVASVRGDYELQQKVFGSTVSAETGRPSNLEYIAAVVLFLRCYHSN